MVHQNQQKCCTLNWLLFFMMDYFNRVASHCAHFLCSCSLFDSWRGRFEWSKCVCVHRDCYWRSAQFWIKLNTVNSIVCVLYVLLYHAPLAFFLWKFQVCTTLKLYLLCNSVVDSRHVALFVCHAFVHCTICAICRVKVFHDMELNIYNVHWPMKQTISIKIKRQKSQQRFFFCHFFVTCPKGCMCMFYEEKKPIILLPLSTAIFSNLVRFVCTLYNISGRCIGFCDITQNKWCGYAVQKKTNKLTLCAHVTWQLT